VIESYQTLKEDAAETSVILLRQISLQLSNQPLDSLQELKTPTFKAPQSSIRVNTLWFFSLVLSLAAALFGILLKGWMREYMRWTSITPPQDAVGLRQHRFEGLHRWKLPFVLGILPALLQIALFLFLCGLLDFLWQLHAFVFAVVGLITIIFLTLAISTLVISVFSRTSPFRSPITSILIRMRPVLTKLVVSGQTFVHRYTTMRWGLVITSRLLVNAAFWTHSSWEEMDLRTIEAADHGRKYPTICRTECFARHRALHHLYANVKDNTVFEKVRPCLYLPNSSLIPLANCWPIVSAILDFETRAISDRRGTHQLWQMKLSSISPARFFILGRAEDLSLGAKRFLATLFIEATSIDSVESDILSAMHLLNVLTRSDIELTQNYLAMLASLLKEQSSHEVILLAFKHMYSALISQPQSLSTDGTVHILSSVQHMSDDFALKTLCP
jgi:hypothetical protein